MSRADLQRLELETFPSTLHDLDTARERVTVHLASAEHDPDQHVALRRVSWYLATARSLVDFAAQNLDAYLVHTEPTKSGTMYRCIRCFVAYLVPADMSAQRCAHCDADLELYPYIIPPIQRGPTPDTVTVDDDPLAYDHLDPSIEW